MKNSQIEKPNNISQEIEDPNDIGSESLAFKGFDEKNLLKTQKIYNDSLFKVHYINAKKLDVFYDKDY